MRLETFFLRPTLRTYFHQSHDHSYPTPVLSHPLTPQILTFMLNAYKLRMLLSAAMQPYARTFDFKASRITPFNHLPTYRTHLLSPTIYLGNANIRRGIAQEE